MVIHNTNILAVPFVLLIELIDLYMILACLRLVFGGATWLQTDPLGSALRRWVDSVPTAVQRGLTRRGSGPLPDGVAWVLVMCASLLARQVALWVLQGLG